MRRDDRAQLAAGLRRWMRQRRISHRRAAKICGCHRSTVTRWTCSTGASMPDLCDLWLLAQARGVSLASMLEAIVEASGLEDRMGWDAAEPDEDDFDQDEDDGEGW